MDLDMYSQTQTLRRSFFFSLMIVYNKQLGFFFGGFKKMNNESKNQSQHLSADFLGIKGNTMNVKITSVIHSINGINYT